MLLITQTLAVSLTSGKKVRNKSKLIINPVVDIGVFATHSFSQHLIPVQQTFTQSGRISYVLLNIAKCK